MKISFHGAAEEVTGSCILIEIENAKFLVDCGMFQGPNSHERNHEFGFEPKSIDFALLTHAHVDHCGRLPRLVKEGFKGKIFCTPPTAELANLMQLDSAKIFLADQNKYATEPLYYDYDVAETKELFSTINYNQEKTIIPGVKVVARDAGHILGSCIFEVSINDQGEWKKLVFSGDLGNSPSVLLNDTYSVDGANYVFVESTYGNSVHEPRAQGREKLKELIKQAVAEKTNLVVPIFALERIQEMLYDLNVMVEQEEIPYVPIFLDSPLAIKATEIYHKYAKEYFNKTANARINAGDDIFAFEGLKFTPSIKQSLAIEKVRPPKIVLAGGGMISGGRIRGYIEDYVVSSKNHILLVSYQAEDTIGRELLNGAKEIKIGKDKVPVRAKISSILSFSSHADEPRLLNWMEKMDNPKPTRFFITHGENETAQALAITIKQKIGVSAEVSEPNKIYEI
ncbi:MAG: MBL fold metallo-hydrolase [Candidatus Paceibacterota bacterium]